MVACQPCSHVFLAARVFLAAHTWHNRLEDILSIFRYSLTLTQQQGSRWSETRSQTINQLRECKDKNSAPSTSTNMGHPRTHNKEGADSIPADVSLPNPGLCSDLTGRWRGRQEASIKALSGRRAAQGFDLGTSSQEALIPPSTSAFPNTTKGYLCLPGDSPATQPHSRDPSLVSRSGYWNRLQPRWRKLERW